MKLSATAGCVAALLAAFAGAADYPNKPIRFIVPWPAGGIADVRARIMAEPLSKALGQPVVVDNRPGASGTLGAEFVAKSKPDGYTLLYGSIQEQAIAPAMLGKLPYDPSNGFTPILQFSLTPVVLLVPSSLQVQDLQDLVRLGKVRGGKLNYGSPGIAHTNHFAAEELKRLAGFEAVHVPYKGEAPMYPDLLSGRVDFAFGYVGTAEPHVMAGKLRALLVTGRQRAPQLPAVPTAGEAGLPGLEIYSWGGLMGPAGLPQAVVQRLNAELKRILQTAQLRSRKEFADSEIVASTPEEFAAFIRREQARWSDLVGASGLQSN
jgi:tripartite-type tricarboxylate transporter receptor subunit TctC